ncbi:beta-ketoacyl-[acyl-carrier-protein] synthase family protein [Pseudomonas sp. KNUC1026]|uniref:beta-ketoacyl-[acyl-carrier-protein] synthase family protein n=1 Tax=Pseudomonas sp. KNUC1026 TaxID=2893890 RepID=UPI001F3FBAFB|nr:beta-ketoacyl-[acyl-carrier-protein] synthase family protein [Pseudomonas sp. KNUC1026]UFH50200.1 beta-ketoacyl-[acyl-carrier-protein] synthase family protein [Pseudomonas sp. KNUC1026]
MQRRVVVTGLGVVSANGIGVDAFWHNIVNGNSGIRPYQWGAALGFESRVYGQAKDFNEKDFDLGARECAAGGRYVQFALAAGQMAMSDAGLMDHALDPQRLGVVVASAIADAASMESQLLQMTHDGTEDIDPAWASGADQQVFDFGLAASRLAQRYGAGGAVLNVSTGCTAGLDALGLALDAIRQGELDVVLAGASEAPLCPLSIGSFEALGALSTRQVPTPQQASTPFSGQRDGFVIAEGAGLLVLEAYEHAVARGARIYAELTGYASVNNAYHMTDLAPDGEALARCIRLAMADAGIEPEQVSYVSAHGSSTPQNDVNETNALKKALHEQAYRVPINSLKSMTGHSLAAANAIEAVSLALEIHHQHVHPTINYQVPDPACDLDYVPLQGRPVAIEHALKLSSGFSGIHSVIVMKRTDHE